jgi:hypothetical protein
MIPALYVGHGGFSFHAISASLYAAVVGYSIFLLDHSQTYDLVAVVDKFVDEPLQRVDGVFVFVEAA